MISYLLIMLCTSSIYGLILNYATFKSHHVRCMGHDSQNETVKKIFYRCLETHAVQGCVKAEKLVYSSYPPRGPNFTAHCMVCKTDNDRLYCHLIQHKSWAQLSNLCLTQIHCDPWTGKYNI